MNTERFFEGPGASSMATYVWEIAIILLGAFILGYLLRFLLNGNYKSTIADLEHENSVLKSQSTVVDAEADLELKDFEKTIKSEIDDLNTRLSECYAKRINAENALSALKTKSANLAYAQVATEKKESIVEAAPIVSNPIVSSPKVSVPISNVADDLKKIEGIGPKIEQLLNADGIHSYKELIASSVDRIKGILIAAGPNYAVHDPSTWAEQATLADSGNWSVLHALQEELKGGKRK
ncbi:hypothetical protein OAD66_05120 [Bacteroidia bacterium]|nr:hypothetical protein [Bacteroidia bacterium]MDB9882496.1 hypothetical protein [Bacteroidia bacterium]